VVEVVHLMELVEQVILLQQVHHKVIVVEMVLVVLLHMLVLEVVEQLLLELVEQFQEVPVELVEQEHLTQF
jgi:hypothetical protein